MLGSRVTSRVAVMRLAFSVSTTQQNPTTRREPDLAGEAQGGYFRDDWALPRAVGRRNDGDLEQIRSGALIGGGTPARSMTSALAWVSPGERLGARSAPRFPRVRAIRPHGRHAAGSASHRARALSSSRRAPLDQESQHPPVQVPPSVVCPGVRRGHGPAIGHRVDGGRRSPGRSRRAAPCPAAAAGAPVVCTLPARSILAPAAGEPPVKREPPTTSTEQLGNIALTSPPSFSAHLRQRR